MPKPDSANGSGFGLASRWLIRGACIIDELADRAEQAALREVDRFDERVTSSPT